jgi:hypothetical protein
VKGLAILSRLFPAKGQFPPYLFFIWPASAHHNLEYHWYHFLLRRHPRFSGAHPNTIRKEFSRNDLR